MTLYARVWLRNGNAMEVEVDPDEPTTRPQEAAAFVGRAHTDLLAFGDLVVNIHELSTVRIFEKEDEA